MDIDTEFRFDGKYENTGSLTNMFLAQSALDESKSLRRMSTGCPYIEAICEELKNRWKTDSITAIFQKFVAEKLQSYKNKTCEWFLTPQFSTCGNVTTNMEMNLIDLLLTGSQYIKGNGRQKLMVVGKTGSGQ